MGQPDTFPTPVLKAGILGSLECRPCPVPPASSTFPLSEFRRGSCLNPRADTSAVVLPLDLGFSCDAQ